MGLASAASSAEAALVPPSADVFFAHYLTLAVFTLAYAFLGALWVCVVPRLRSKALRGLVHSFAVGVLAATYVAARRITNVHMARYSILVLTWVFLWKAVELLAGIYPDDCVRTDFWSACVYMASPIEAKFEKGKLQRASLRTVSIAVRRFLRMQVVLTLWASLFPTTESFIEPTSIPIVNSYVQTWLLYLFLCQQMNILIVALAVIQAEPIEIMREPLTKSRSPRDFWGCRWNLVVHGLLKRTVFLPVKEAGWGSVSATVATFFVSGIFHVYILLGASDVANRRDASKMLCFFVVQAPLTVFEVAAIRKFPRFVRLPTWFCVIGSTIMIVPLAPFFMEPYTRGGMFNDIFAMQPRLNLHAEAFSRFHHLLPGGKPT